jgi:hypothetical protein
MIKEYTDNISKFVIGHGDLRVQNLSSKISIEVLLEMHQTMDGRKAVGVDGETKEEYSKHLLKNVEDLVSRLKRDSYNPKPSKRVRIPKPGKQGKTRPLGISMRINLSNRLWQVSCRQFMNLNFWSFPMDLGQKEAVTTQ